MKRLIYTVMALSMIAAAAHASSVVRNIHETLDLQSGEVLDLDLPVGELQVEGRAAGKAKVSVEIECSSGRRRCLSAAEEIELTVRRRGNRQVLEIDGWPRWGTGGLSVNVIALVPYATPVAIDMGVGQVTVEGLESDLWIDLGVGEIEVMMKSDHVNSVNLDTGIGKSSIVLAGQRLPNERSFLGGEADWSEGKGAARIRIDVGVGAIEVELE